MTFLETAPFLHAEMPHCKDISQNFERMAISFIACSSTRQQALALDHSLMVDAALCEFEFDTPAVERQQRHMAFLNVSPQMTATTYVVLQT